MRRTLLLLSLLAGAATGAGSCARACDGGQVGVEEASGSPSGAVDEASGTPPSAVPPAPTAAEILVDQCTAIGARLKGPGTPAAGPLDVEAARASLAAAAPEAIPQLITPLALAGSSSLPLLPELEARISATDLAVSEAVFRALPRIDVESTLRIGERSIGDPVLSAPLRFMAAASLGALGEPGVARLNQLYFATEDADTRAAVLRGLEAARGYPFAIQRVVVYADAVCALAPMEPVCLDLTRLLTLVWESAVPPTTELQQFLGVERAGLLNQDGGFAAWSAAVAPLLATSPQLAADSVARMQSLGPMSRLVEISLATLEAPTVSANDRKSQVYWLLSLGAGLDAHRDAFTRAARRGSQERVGPLTWLVAVAAGVPVSGSSGARLAAYALSDPSPHGMLAALAAARVSGASAVRDFEREQLPPGFARALAAAPSAEVGEFLAVVLDEQVDAALALDFASIWSGGRRDAVAAALLARTEPPTARELAVAARSATPSPELGARFAPVVMEAPMTTDIAEWLVAAGQRLRVVERGRAALADPSVSKRRRGVQWLNVGFEASEAHPITETLPVVMRTEVLDAMIGPGAPGEVEGRDVRFTIALHALAMQMPPLDPTEALGLASRAPVGQPGAAEANLLLTRTYLQHCNTLTRPPGE